MNAEQMSASISIVVNGEKASETREKIAKRFDKLTKYPPLNTGGINLEKRLIPYHMQSVEKNSYLFYNDVRHRANLVPSGDAFRAKELDVPHLSCFHDVLCPRLPGTSPTDRARVARKHPLSMSIYISAG